MQTFRQTRALLFICLTDGFYFVSVQVSNLFSRFKILTKINIFCRDRAKLIRFRLMFHGKLQKLSPEIPDIFSQSAGTNIRRPVFQSSGEVSTV
jgi:hypothetical protein